VLFVVQNNASAGLLDRFLVEFPTFLCKSRSALRLPFACYTFR